MEKIIKKIWANRPFRTFLQGFIATITGGYALDMNVDALKALLVSALMAGLSAAMMISTGEE